MKKCICCFLLILAACGGGGGSEPAASPPIIVEPPPPPPPGPNQAPIADAGSDQSVDEGTVVFLTGTSTDTDGSIVVSSWQQVGGAAVDILDASTTNASFVAPSVSTSAVLEFRFRVQDDDGAIGSDTVTVTVSDVTPTSTANLNEFISSLNVRFSSETATLESEQRTAQAQASAAGNYLSGGYLADARDRFISHLNAFFDFLYDEAIRLTDNGTFFSHADITAELDWQRSQWQTYLDRFLASGFFSGHSSNNLDSIIRVDVLTALDAAINSALSRLEASGRLTAPPPPQNQAPTANAGSDQTVSEESTVDLSGGGADADGLIVSFNWQQDSGKGVVITDADMEIASFVAPMTDAPQELIFRMLVTDNDGAIGSDTVSVTVSDEPIPPANQPPTADAGVDQIVDEGTTVNLSGMGTDNDGTIDSYQWQQDSGTSVSIVGDDTANASFTAPEVATSEDLVIRLTVTDNDGATGSDTVTITVNDVPPPTVLEWSIDLNDPTGVVGNTRPLFITGTLTNSPSSNVNLGIIGGTQGIPPGFDYEVSGLASTSAGYLFDWAPDGAESFIKQFESVNLSPGESFDFEFAGLAPTEQVTPGATYTSSLELQLFDAPRPGPIIGSSFDSVSWTVADNFGLVFVTNQVFNGNLGGLQGADDKCNAEASAAGLVGTYVAWLSDSTTDARDRIRDQGYITVAGAVVATGLADLTDGTIGAPIDVDAEGIPVPIVAGSATGVWTNTTPSGVDFGQSASPDGDACGDWTLTAGAAAIGSILRTGVQWTGGGTTVACNFTYRLYCFGQ